MISSASLVLLLAAVIPEGPRPVVEARHPAVRTWIHRIAGSSVEVRAGGDAELSASQIAVRLGASRVSFDLDAETSTASVCLDTPHPPISCAARKLEALWQGLADPLPQMREQFREGARRYRGRLLWLRSRILSELGNNDLTGLQLAAVGPDLQPQLADVGLDALRCYPDVTSALADLRGGARPEALFYPEDLPPEQQRQLRDAGDLTFSYRRLEPGAGLEDYDRATGFNLKQALEAVRMVGEARRHRRAKGDQR